MLENSPKYIDRALKLGYDVEIDIRVIEGTYNPKLVKRESR